MTDMTYRCPIRQNAQNRPQAAAVITPKRTFTYQDLDHLVTAFQGHLLKNGIRAQQHVAVLAEQDIRYPGLLWALWRIGAVACPLNPNIPDPALKAMLSSLNSPVILSETSSGDLVQVDINLCPLSSRPPSRNPSRIKSGTVLGLRVKPGITHWKNLCHSLPEEEDRPVPPNAPAVIIHTSASTGRPKAAVLSLENLIFNARGSNERLPVGPQDRWLLSLPLYHVSGLGVLFRTALAGGATVIPHRDEPMDAGLQKYGITHVSMVPTQLRRLMHVQRSGKDFPRLKLILLGGGPVSRSLQQEAGQSGFPIAVTYGLTETASQMATSPWPRKDKIPSNLPAKVLPYREAKVSPNGEILVRGKTLFLGYWVKGKLDRPFDEDGWFATGDIGQVSDDGELTVTGRKDTMFISGGENIHPEHIEKVLLDIPGVEAALVIPVDDPEFETRSMAFVRSESCEMPPAAKIRQALQGRLAPYQIPKSYFLMPDIPGFPSPKLNRREVRGFLLSIRDQWERLRP